MERRIAEVAARAAALRHRDNFAQVDELRTMGAQYLASNDQSLASEYFRQADALQRRIQATLDRGEQVVREEINVVAPSYQWFNAGFDWSVTRAYGAGNYLDPNYGGISRTANTPPKPKLTTVETVDRKPRVIELEPEDL